jgi:hypothetical protein
MKHLASAFVYTTIRNPKASAYDMLGRRVEVKSDPSNLLVPRCKHAGKLLTAPSKEEALIVMANGIVVTAHGYYNNFSDVLREHENAAVHEAAEERMFSAIVDTLSPGAVIV